MSLCHCLPLAFRVSRTCLTYQALACQFVSARPAVVGFAFGVTMSLSFSGVPYVSHESVSRCLHWPVSLGASCCIGLAFDATMSLSSSGVPYVSHEHVSRIRHRASCCIAGLSVCLGASCCCIGLAFAVTMSLPSSGVPCLTNLSQVARHWPVKVSVRPAVVS